MGTESRTISGIGRHDGYVSSAAVGECVAGTAVRVGGVVRMAIRRRVLSRDGQLPGGCATRGLPPRCLADLLEGEVDRNLLRLVAVPRECGALLRRCPLR